MNNNSNNKLIKDAILMPYKNYKGSFYASYDHHIEKITMVDMWNKCVEQYKTKILVEHLNKKYSYQDIDKLSNILASKLLKYGIKKGDPIGILMNNNPIYIITMLAILKSGAYLVNLSPLASSDQILDQINQTSTKLVVTLNLNVICKKLIQIQKKGFSGDIVLYDFCDSLTFFKKYYFKFFKRSLLYNNANKNIIKYNDMPYDLESLELPKISHEDIALYQFTGGTTGSPKVAVIKHKNISANVQQSALWFKFNSEDHALIILPMFHIFAFTVSLWCPMLLGVSISLMPKYDINTLINDIERTKANIISAVPSIYQSLNIIRNPRKIEILSKIKIAISGGAPLLEKVAKKFKEISGVDIVEGYGLTETSPILTANINGFVQNKSAGVLFPSTEISLRSINEKDFNEKIEYTNQCGEICARGPQVFEGYLDKSKNKEAFTEDGYYRTGDLGYISDEGFLYIIDRRKDMLINSGVNVFPSTIESAAISMNGIDEAAVIGVPDVLRGETPLLLVVLKDGESITKNDIHEFLSSRLSKYELPKIRHINILNEIPKTPIGKFDKNKLKSMYVK